MLLALEMTPQLWAVSGLAVTTLGAGLYAWLLAKKHDKAARVAHAAFAGARAAIADLQLGKDQVLVIEDAFRAAAKDWDVETHVDGHIGDGLAVAPSKG